MRTRTLLAAAALALCLAPPLSACHRKTNPGDQGLGRQDLDAADAYLKRNAHDPGVIALPSGLQYRVVHSGPAGGEHPARGDEIKVIYTGSLLSGAVFDSNRQTGQPAVLTLDGLVPGWMEALPKMRPGDEWILYLPPKLGYGEQGRPPVIAPDSLLVFDLQLLGVLKTKANA